MHMSKFSTYCIESCSTHIGFNPEKYEAIVHGNTGK